MLTLATASIFGALRLLDVRDWRCYGLTIVWAPAINSLALGAVTSFLLVGAAAVWRFRSREALAGPLAALSAVLKVLLWPLGVWLLATRRLRASVAFLLTGTAVTAIGWAAIGFAGLRTYPRLLHVLATAEQSVSYSPVALLGLTGTAATVLSVLSVGFVTVGVWATARGDAGERRSFAAAIIGSLLATPILWEHYLLLLVVPIALYRPRLSPLWLLPLALWVSPAAHSHGVSWRIALLLAVVAVVALRTVGGDAVRRFAPSPSRSRSLPRLRRALSVD
jgi:hypothetical protein